MDKIFSIFFVSTIQHTLVEETKSGEWKLKKNSWLGEKEEEVPDEYDSEDVWNQICDQRRKRGYVDYSVLEL